MAGDGSGQRFRFLSIVLRELKERGHMRHRNTASFAVSLYFSVEWLTDRLYSNSGIAG